VEHARQRGYDVNHGEWIEGLTVVAAPIVAVAHGLCGCVASAAVQGVVSAAAIEALVAQTQASALAVAGKLEG
jgi:DNA-binding IclR family transcriptional regulator